MAYAKTLFQNNFLEYASYVIKERAIPDIEDGLKPVQRRILHSLLEMDDGKFHKVANVVGHCMKYHPHGDSSIYEALVNLANMNLFIDRQGNFGNFLTGDVASAARYIECRSLPFAKMVLHNPDLTEFQESYDGRNTEPVAFPAKIPVLLVLGAEGIAVGMATKVLPNNLLEVFDAVSAALKGEDFTLLPDFPGGGFLDVSEYADGQGKVLVRAKLNTKDPKRIIVEELPFGVTTEKLIASVEAAAKKGKLKIASINDFTTSKVNIEITLARNTYTQDVIDALYAFTDCEQSISVNLLVIRDKFPVQMTVTEVILYHAKSLIKILRRELEVERAQLLDKLHARTLERIFIEERVYKRIETQKTRESVIETVITGMDPFRDQIQRDVTENDVERLLKIPIRRISLYDINKAQEEVREIHDRLKAIAYHLAHLIEYALDYIQEMKNAAAGITHPRFTKIIAFDKVEAREAANRDLIIKYDLTTGYIGYGLKSGIEQCKVSHYDRLLIIKKSGTYFVTDAPEKLFVDKGMRLCSLTDKEILENQIITVIYQDRKSKDLYIKRCQITQFIMNKTYELVPENCKIVNLFTKEDAEIYVEYKPRKRLKVLEERFYFHDYLVKGVKAGGVRLTSKEVKTLKVRRNKQE
ncbi:MAG: DNA topoisomerase IV subunit A [Spirochaetia bacterium]|nr:DNA topoisomerase IV subunit A [Spirochaetia bacterium]